MHFDGHAHKVAADHLRRRAYLYIRQSSIRQVLENTELKLTLFVIEPIRTGIAFDESVRNSDRIRMQSDIVFKF